MESTQTRWSELAAENEAELLAYLGSAAGATSQRSADLTWVVTGVNHEAYNGVVWTQLSPNAADMQVPALVEQFRFQGVPALWRIDATTEPADLGARLEALGCTRVPDGLCMGAQLPALAREMSRYPGLTIDRVLTSPELDEWLDIWTETSGERRDPRGLLYESLGFGARQPLHHYVARINGRPAGVAELFLGQRAAGLYSLAIAPAYRGRGIGTALVLTPLLVARTMGYDVGVVRSLADNRLMFEHLGFEASPQPSIGYRIT
jgi:ribosomal protein S18 acetylase RimI-like enzyme